MSRPRPVVRALCIIALVLLGTVVGTVGVASAAGPVAPHFHGGTMTTSGSAADPGVNFAISTDGPSTNTSEDGPTNPAGTLPDSVENATDDTTSSDRDALEDMSTLESTTNPTGSTNASDARTSAGDIDESFETGVVENTDGTVDATADTTGDPVGSTGAITDESPIESVSSTTADAVASITREVNTTAAGELASLTASITAADRPTNAAFGIVGMVRSFHLEPSEGDTAGDPLADGGPTDTVGDHRVPQPPAETSVDARSATTESDPSGAPQITDVATGNLPPLSTSVGSLGALVVAGVAGRQCLAAGASSPGAGLNVLRHGGRIASRANSWGWRDWLWRIHGLFGYQRYDETDPLEHESRATIHGYLEDAPGSYLSEISEETDIPLPTARYHLKILEHENLVFRSKMRGKRRYFPAGAEPSKLDAALDDVGAAAVLRALADHGPDSVSGLAEKLDRDVSTVSHHLQQLEGDGLVTREQDGPAVMNRLSPTVRERLAPSEADPSMAETPGEASARTSD